MREKEEGRWYLEDIIQRRAQVRPQRKGGGGGVGDTTLKGAREKRLEGGGGEDRQIFF